MTNAYSFLHESSVNQRLDAAILVFCATKAELKDLTRSQIKLLIERGQVLVNKVAVIKAGTPLKQGQTVSFDASSALPSHLSAYDFKLSILHEDEDLIVVDKPAGISMHPGAGNKTTTLVNALIGQFSKQSEFFASGQRPGIVHRLDKDTTGVVVVAKNVAAQHALSQQFAARSVNRAYKALVFSTPRGSRVVRQKDCGTIEASIGRDPNRKTAMAIVTEGGRPAVTHWRVAERFQYAVLLDVRLETGRTHQIRVHLNSLGCPVIGDKTYGDFSGLPSKLRIAQDKFGRQCLHAFLLGFEHPKSKKKLVFESALPSDFAKLIELFKVKV